jgi:predicted membrane protein
MTLAEAKGRKPWRARSWSRAAALAVAGATSLALTLDPYILNRASSASLHEGLPLLMLGVSNAFAYGLGFRPASRSMRAFISPVAAWALLVAGAAFIFVN